MKTLVVLPNFMGFYESMFSSEIDYEVENYHAEKGGEVPAYTVDFSYLAKKATEYFGKEVGLQFEFESLVMPREYNFSTDRIFAYLDLQTLQTIFNETPASTLEAAIKKSFTSRPGFLSYYPNSLAEWPADLTKWDHNHFSTLLTAYFAHKGIDTEAAWFAIAEEMSGNGVFSSGVTFKPSEEV